MRFLQAVKLPSSSLLNAVVVYNTTWKALLNPQFKFLVSELTWTLAP
jgi:hypothetical protein